MITRELLAERRLHTVRLEKPYRVADLIARAAAGFGITLEVHSLPTYEATQAWALRLRQAGAEGLLYLARHEPSARHSVALFGHAGEARERPPGQAQRADEPWLLDALWRECRVLVAERPRRDQIQIID